MRKRPKHKSTRADRNSPEATVEENSKPYDEIGQTDEEIRRKEQSIEPGPIAIPPDAN